MRCPDCAKFVSYDEPQVELDDEHVEGLAYTASIRVTLPCADCGTELKEYTFEYDTTLEKCKCEDGMWDTDSSDFNGADKRDIHRAGKMIPYRSQKQFYGYSADVMFKCTCGESQSIEFGDYAQASHFEEL